MADEKVTTLGPFSPTCSPPNKIVCVGTPGKMTSCACDGTKAAAEQICTVSVSYSATNPSQPFLHNTDVGCDAPGVALAFAVIVSRLLAWAF